ncbi:MAG: hypothetical protein F4246_09455 [Rhodothermaceae bacterium]|nr:hypothetical protein [Rhodothermaceae bacterium]MXX59719.1 hypothetical protein [Rhodothermaceae bacterium]MYD20219.1 hypothetical protein [Rhodothermaceae bacterium]MYD57229.1 hypothetical protein [Rhodothermaceae bacterium]MYI43567.1 hypothetical protein [Rhodothermaceae bacterium]
MKIWKSYGSEHSMNLVMIGSFKKEDDAEKVEEELRFLFEEIRSLDDSEVFRDRFSDDVKKLLYSKEIYCLMPQELEQFQYDHSFERDGKKIRYWTDEWDVSAALKIMLTGGAKVEIFSGDNYRESDVKE